MKILKGNFLRKMRLTAGLTTEQMRKIVGVRTRKTIENWEKDVGSPNFDQAITIMLACEVAPAQFINAVLRQETA